MGYLSDLNSIGVSVLINGIFLGSSNGTDDTALIQAAMDAGKPVHFKKGETYIYRNQMNMAADQILYGNGATLKRGNAVATHGIHMGSNCRIYDLTIDGNKANQTSPLWTTHQEINTADNCIVEGVKINNAPAEGFLVAGSHVRIRDCFITDSGGNGIHFSGSNDVVVDGCYVVNANLTVGTGHEDGCIIWSNSCQNTVVTNCWMENGISGIGSIDSVDNSDVTVTNCVIKNCRTTAIDMINPSTNPANIIFKNNRIYNSIKVSIKDTSNSAATTTIPSKIIFEGNYLEKTWFEASHSKDIIVRGNIFDATGAAISQVMFIGDCFDVLVEGNEVIGGDYAIYVGDGLAVTANVLTTGNNFKNQRLYGIRLQCTNRPSVSATNNIISNDVTADATYSGILVNTGCLAQGNQINLSAGQYGINAAGNNAYVTDNIVRTSAAIPSIKTSGGSTGIIIMNNLTTQAIANSGGAGNTLVNNQIIAA